MTKQLEKVSSFRTIHRLFQVMEVLASNPEGLTLTEILAHLDNVPKSSVYNLLQQMSINRFIDYDALGTKRYRIGSSMIRLSSVVMYNNTIKRQARPFLTKLSEDTGEDTYLGILDGNRLTYIDKVEGTESVRLNIAVGSRRYLHNNVIGKLILAFSSAEEQLEFIENNAFPKTARNTIVDKKLFLEELKKIKNDGFSITDEESIDGIFAIAAPIRNEEGHVLAGICVSVPVHRANTRFSFLKEKVISAGLQISKSIGFHSNNE